MFTNTFLRFDFDLNKVEKEMRGNKVWRIEAPHHSPGWIEGCEESIQGYREALDDVEVGELPIAMQFDKSNS